MPRTTFYGHNHVQVTFQPNIGLDAATRQSVVDLLNLLLADETVLLNKTPHAAETARGNVQPELQPLFLEQCNEINYIIREITERIQILGGTQISGSKELINSSRLDNKHLNEPEVMNALADQEALIRFLREDSQKCFEFYEDQGTAALLVNTMRLHEKMAWKLRSRIENEMLPSDR